MAYLQTQWNTGDPITQSRMNHIEEGIAAALDTADGAVLINNIQNTRLDNLDGDIRALNDRIGGGGSSGETLEGKISVINAKLGNGVSDVLGQTVTDQLAAINTTIGNDFSASEGSTITDRFASLTTRVDLNLEQATLAWNELIKSGVTYDSTNKIVTNALKDIMYTKLLAREAYLTPLATDKIPGENNTEKTISSLADRITHIYRTINTVDGKTVTNANGIRDLAERTSSIESNIGLGAVSVGDRLDHLDGGYIFDQSDLPSRNIKSLIEEINNAHISTNYLDNENHPIDYGTLLARFNASESKINNINSEISAAHRIGIPNSNNDGYIDDTLDLRFDHIDGGTKPTRTLPSVISEIETARDNAASLNDRISALDNSLNSSSLIARVGALETNKVNISDIRNDLTHDESNKPLSAALGKLLKDTIGGDYNASNTVASAISDLLDVDTATDTRIDAIDTRIDAIDGGATPSRTLPNLIDEVEGARSSTIKGTLDELTQEVTPLVYNTVDERLEAMEKDIDTIAKDLDMYDSTTGEISDLHTRVDTIAANLIQMANEIGMILDNAMVHDLQSAWTDTSTRIDSVTSEIEAAHRTNLGNDELTGEPIVDTLDKRFDDIETQATSLEGTITHQTTGLAATKAIADEALTKANAAAVASDMATALAGKASTQSVSDLTGRVSTLEGKDTIVIDLPQSGSNYDNNGKPDTAVITAAITTFKPNADYLIQADDEKYYYWRYINDEWEMISGAGGGGSGTSSAEFANTLQDITTPNINTDYFVGNNNDGYIHYRYKETIVNEQTTLTPVIIANYIDPNEVNKYRIQLRDIPVSAGAEETNPWLYLYKFGYGESADIDTDESFTDPIWATRQVDAIQLPAGGGGGGPVTTIKVTRITPRAITAAKDSKDKKTYIRFFFTDGEGGETYRYSLSLNGRTIIASSQNTLITSGDPANKSSSWPTKVVMEDGEEKTVLKDQSEVPLGFYSIEITPYCTTLGLNQPLILTITSTENENISARTTWDLSIIQFNLTSSSADGLIVNKNDDVILKYTPSGAIDKVLHVLVGETEYTRNLSASTMGREYEFTIPANSLTHGAHMIEMYMTAEINNGNDELRTDSIYKEYIWYDPTNDINTVIIASPKANGKLEEILSYTEIQIPYSVYHKASGEYNIYYYLGYNTASQKLIGSIAVEGNYNGIITYAPFTNAKEEIQTITIVVEESTLDISLKVTSIDKDVSPITGAIIDFDPTGLTNNSIDRLPSWNVDNTTYSLSASSNFNWSDDISGGGYKEDKDGKCFVIKAGSYIDLNYPMFANTREAGTNNNLTIFDRGAEMKIIFKVSAVRNIDAVWFSNTGTVTEKTVGLSLGAHSGELRTDKAAGGTVKVTPDEFGHLTINDTTYNVWLPETAYALEDVVVVYDETDEDNHMVVYKCIKAHTSVSAELKDTDSDAWEDYFKNNWLKVGKIDAEILATNSYLYMPYSEEDKIELDININKYDRNAKNNFIMAYEDGVPSKVYSYTYGSGGDVITHSNTIRIGSPDCDVYIYKLRIYNKSLTTEQILQNFIADGRNILEKLLRYDRNCIYWSQADGKYYTSPSENAVLDPVKLAQQIPNVKVLMLDTPVFTTGKKNYVMNSSLRCIHAVAPDGYEGNIYYASRGDADNWFFQNGFHAGQGTTSDNYGLSARNVDFLFEADGEHWPAVEKDMKKTYKVGDYPNYKSSVLIGEEASEWVETEPDSGIYHWVPTREPTVNEICSGWKEDNCKVSLTQTSVPNNYFNLKVNVASSENVNNALFQARYDQFIAGAYSSPATAMLKAKHANTYANINDIKVKNSMEFVPAVLFIRENQVDENGNPYGHNEFDDCNWHFYALGNIGDSKKTDYTRAYDPDDMNEFTCENSDNNTNNGQFQSGVFVYRNNRAIETPYDLFSSGKAYKNGARVIVDGKIYIRTGADQSSGTAWNVAEWQLATLTNWTDEGQPYFAPLSAPNTMEYLYPISPSEWNVKVGDDYVNIKHSTLVKEKFDGDHSFEFRYACRGDYRDGKLINDTNGDSDILVDALDPSKGYKTKDTVQETLNHDVVLAFYEWLITSTPEQYVAEAELWFIKPAMEFFYAYTHYYTMMDNRAKNTFWHFADTGVRRPVPIGRAFPALMHIYEEKDGNDYIPASGSFDNNKQYYTKYAFDLWAYDMDTALGIDNNGALVFPYGKEDTDYRTENDPLSGTAFNGAGSIFWRRLSTTFRNEITDIMNGADENCFNPLNLIDQFDHFQECFPEEIWRLDIERKYIRTFTGLSQDNSITVGKLNPRFLTSMMLGRKKYQRRQWVRDLSVYFNSKYRLTDIIANENTVEFNCTTPSIPEWTAGTSYSLNQKVFYAPEVEGEEVNRRVYRCIQANSDNEFISSKWAEDVTPTYHLSLTPYQDMYLNVLVGNGNYQDSYVTTGEPTLRAKAGLEYIFDITGNYQETRIYINGANHLSGIGNLAPMYPYSFDLRALAHIKTLDIGTNDAGYTNTKFTELKLPNHIPLLETLNIKNCHSLAGTIELTEANNIREVEALGTAITGIDLPDYTSIRTLHIPSTISTLNLYGARFLNDFKVYNNAGNIDYGSLYKLYTYDSDYSSNINWIDIAIDMLNKLSLETIIELLKLNIVTIPDLSSLVSMSRFKSILDTDENSQGHIDLSGTITITGNWSKIEAKKYTNNIGYYNNNTWTPSLTQQEINNNPNPIWPNITLIIDPSKEQFKCAVNYYESGYYRNGTYVEPVFIDLIFVNKDGTEKIPDPYVGKSGNQLPHREPTISNVFSFGAYNEESQYIEYSGWTDNNDASIATSLTDQGYSKDVPFTPSGTQDVINLYTFYHLTEHQYTVQWKLNGITVKEVTEQYYGGGYTLEAPTAAQLRLAGHQLATVTTNNDGTYSYSIFDGWEKLPTNIQPTEAEAVNSIYVINAKWKTIENKTLYDANDSSSIFYNIPNLTLNIELLLILSKLGYNTIQNTNVLKDVKPLYKLLYTMGYNGAIPGIELINSNNVKRVSSSTTPIDATYVEDGTIKRVYPFRMNLGFTIAIDYLFGASNQSTLPEVLLGCYDKTESGSVTGFALYRGYDDNRGGTGTFVCYGISPNNIDSSKRKLVGDTTHRNIIVLRHEAGSSNLYVYTSLNTTTDWSLNTTIDTSASTRCITLPAQNLSENALICIGHLRSDISSNNTFLSERNSTRSALGTVYWIKYWDQDLGVGECKLLASWPREQMTAAITAIKGTTTNLASTEPKLYLTNLNTSNLSYVTNDTFTNASGNNTTAVETGWMSSKSKVLCDNRIFPGLPIELLAIIGRPTIGFHNYTSRVNPDSGTSEASLSILNYAPNSFVYLPSISSLNTSYISKYQLESLYELTGATDPIEPGAPSITPYTWMNTAPTVISAKMYTGSGSEQRWADASSNIQSYWFNIRFKDRPITWSTSNKLNIYMIDSTYLSGDTFYNAIGSNNIRTGDIVIYTTLSGAKTEGVYMYISLNDLLTYGMQIQPQSGEYATGSSNSFAGGWIKSTPYVTRSATDISGRYSNYIYITELGLTISPSASTDVAASGSLNLNFAFTV